MPVAALTASIVVPTVTISSTKNPMISPLTGLSLQERDRSLREAFRQFRLETLHLIGSAGIDGTSRDC